MPADRLYGVVSHRPENESFFFILSIMGRFFCLDRNVISRQRLVKGAEVTFRLEPDPRHPGKYQAVDCMADSAKE